MVTLEPRRSPLEDGAEVLLIGPTCVDGFLGDEPARAVAVDVPQAALDDLALLRLRRAAPNARPKGAALAAWEHQI